VRVKRRLDLIHGSQVVVDLVAGEGLFRGLIVVDREEWERLED
jgi:hypothetical protein